MAIRSWEESFAPVEEYDPRDQPMADSEQACELGGTDLSRLAVVNGNYLCHRGAIFR